MKLESFCYSSSTLISFPVNFNSIKSTSIGIALVAYWAWHGTWVVFVASPIWTLPLRTRTTAVLSVWSNWNSSLPFFAT